MAYVFVHALFYVFAVILLPTLGHKRYTLASKNEHHITVNGTQFILDGSPYLFNGFNSYWLMNIAIQPNDRHKVTEMLREANTAGLSVCRTLAFSDGGSNALQISPGNYNENTFQALDFVISEAGNYGIRLILTLVNNWADFGGKAQYIKWARNAGVKIKDSDDFYNNQVIKQYYKNYVQKIITRKNTITGVTYRDDPAVMAWELMNEPRCERWAQEMASFVKSIDNKHLLGTGMEGFYGDSVPERKKYQPYQVGTDFFTNHQIPEIDFASIHLYTFLWLKGQSESVATAFMQRWIESHWEDSKQTIKKPLLLGEFGKTMKDSNYNIDVRDRFVRSVYRTTDEFAKQGGAMGGSLIWQLMAEGMDSYHDGYEVVLSQMPSTARIISAQSRQMASMAHSIGNNLSFAS